MLSFSRWDDIHYRSSHIKQEGHYLWSPGMMRQDGSFFRGSAPVLYNVVATFLGGLCWNLGVET
jgi:hypothetical protein